MAAPKFDVRMDGIKDLEFKLGALDKALGKKLLRQAVRASAKPIRDEAARLAPRRVSEPPRGTSRYHPAGKELHRSIKVRSAGRLPGSTLAVQVKTAPHGHLLEFGTIHMAAQPFMRPAYDTQKGEAIRTFREVLGKKIEAEVRR